MSDDMYDEEQFFDKLGNAISRATFWELWKDREYVRVAVDDLGLLGRVSTVWLGFNYAFTPGQVIIFETLIFGGEYDGEMWRYTTEEEAIAGHTRVVELLRDGTLG